MCRHLTNTWIEKNAEWTVIPANHLLSEGRDEDRDIIGEVKSMSKGKMLGAHDAFWGRVQFS